MTQKLRVAHRLRLAHEYLGWMSIHASRIPTLADAIATAAEELDHVEAVLGSNKHKRADRAVADSTLGSLEQRLLDLAADVETQLWRRAPAPRRAPESGLVVESTSPLREDLQERIALIDSDIVRLRATATHPTARDTLGRAAAALLDARWWLNRDLDLEVFANVESALELAAWRVRAVQEAMDRFGPAAIVEIVERPRPRERPPRPHDGARRHMWRGTWPHERSIRKAF